MYLEMRLQVGGGNFKRGSAWRKQMTYLAEEVALSDWRVGKNHDIFTDIPENSFPQTKDLGASIGFMKNFATLIGKIW